MERIKLLHKEAMSFAERAYLARLKGRTSEAAEFANQAYLRERDAALSMSENIEWRKLEPTRSVLLRSAATLAMDCGLHREAEQLIGLGLGGCPPEDIAEEMRDLLEQVYFLRHLSLRGIHLSTNEVQFSIWGSSTGLGVAHSDDFITRLEDLETVIYRTGERLEGVEFREQGRIAPRVREQLEVYVSVPRAASMAISLRLGGATKQEGLPGIDFQKEVVDEVIECIDLYEKRDVRKLRRRIENEAYFNNFLALARKMAPDGENVKVVGLTVVRQGKEKSVAMRQPRSEAHRPTSDGRLRKSDNPKVFRGVLKYADARRRARGRIDIISADGHEYKVRVPTGMMADIVRPMFDCEVIVRGKEVGRVIELEQIDRAEDASK